ncbi:unnamed protein product [Musa acuminata subsp. burmannicoides]
MLVLFIALSHQYMKHLQVKRMARIREGFLALLDPYRMYGLTPTCSLQAAQTGIAPSDLLCSLVVPLSSSLMSCLHLHAY